MNANPEAARSPWWRGTRGEWYVVAQIALMALILFGPRTIPGLPAWPDPVARIARWIGIVSMVAGGVLLLAGIFRLGPGLTPLPYPTQSSVLIQSGPYRLVRHPMYAGGILLGYGWALFAHGWLTLVYATVILIFLDVKSTREERWLVEKFSEYPQYRRRVRKLIPFLY